MSDGILQPYPYRVVDKHQETEDTVTLELLDELGNGEAVAPGQFNMLYAFGIGEVPISLSSYHKAGEPVLHTVKGVGKVSQALCRLEPGDSVGVRGPFGQPWPLDRLKGKHALIIAGGLGLAPLRPVVQWLAREPEACERVTVLYGARTHDGLLYPEDLVAWNDALNGRVHATVDFSTSSWVGHVGPVITLIPLAAGFDNTVVLTCGPEIMMRFTIAKLRDLGIASEDIYLSMERNMKCAVGHCGHCQFVGDFLCKEGPVFSFDHVERFFGKQEV